MFPGSFTQLLTKHMKKIQFVAFLLFIFLYSPCFAQETSFTIEKGFLIVPAKIKKNVSVEVIIATGSEYSTLNSDVIQKYKLPLSYTNDGPVTGSNDRIITFSNVPDVSVGGSKATSLYMRFVSLEKTGKIIGREIYGILGADFFKGKIVRFDFKKRVVKFLDQSPVDGKNAKPAANGVSPLIFKMSFSQKVFYGSDITLPVADEVFYNGKKIKTLFNTASAAPVSISPAVAREAGFEAAPDKGATKVAQIKSLKFYDYEINDVPVMLFGKNAGFDQSSREYGGIIGLGVLQNFLFTLDFKEKMILLE